MKLLQVLLQPSQQFRITRVKTDACTRKQAGHSFLCTRAHTRTHVRSISAGDRLFCRLHAAATVAARAPRLCSRSHGTAVSDIPARQLCRGQLCHPGPLAEFFSRWLLGRFQLAFGGCWATGQWSWACREAGQRVTQTCALSQVNPQLCSNSSSVGRGPVPQCHQHVASLICLLAFLSAVTDWKYPRAGPGPPEAEPAFGSQVPRAPGQGLIWFACCSCSQGEAFPLLLAS